MKKYEILYQWPIAYLEYLANSAAAEQFADGLAEPQLTSFTSLTEELRNYRASLLGTLAQARFWTQWGALRDTLTLFSMSFPQFPGLSIIQAGLFVLIADKLSAIGVAMDDADVDAYLFDLYRITDQFPTAWFSSRNSVNFEDSLIVMNLNEMSQCGHELGREPVSAELLFHLLGRLSQTAMLSGGTFVLAKRMHTGISLDEISAFARLVMLAHGKSVHSVRNYTAAPAVVDIAAIKVGAGYQQLNEVLYVLSEYNSRAELLTKYLTLYHVVENFMFKRPIVELEGQHGGKMFSIREFRRLYSSLEGGEINALKKLFIEVFPLAADHRTHRQIIIGRWQALTASAPVVDIERVLRQLDVRRQGSLLKHNQFAGSEPAVLFAQMVYAMRNVIVHNKETEWHLTYAGLDAATSAVLERFLLPCLEEICFSLVSKRNSLIWYTNQHLALY
jgi:hypothetical protein